MWNPWSYTVALCTPEGILCVLDFTAEPQQLFQTVAVSYVEIRIGTVIVCRYENTWFVCPTTLPVYCLGVEFSLNSQYDASLHQIDERLMQPDTPLKPSHHTSSSRVESHTNYSDSEIRIPDSVHKDTFVVETAFRRGDDEHESAHVALSRSDVSVGCRSSSAFHPSWSSSASRVAYMRGAGLAGAASCNPQHQRPRRHKF